MKTVFHWQFSLLLLPVSFFLACTGKSLDHPEETASSNPKLFTLVSPDSSNVHFANELTEGPNTNVLMYEYLYNGGGVAAADFNNDGYIDLYFTSNMGNNKCYLNLGNWHFRDVTDQAGVGGRPGPWKTGISAADVNGDGKPDLYLCYSGALPGPKRANQLFINTGNDSKGVPHFEEKAAAYGLDSQAFSNQGYFFDYDRDGDLDMILLNHNPKSLPVLDEANTREFLKQDAPLEGIRLYQQTDGRFNDVTVQANISGSALTYGLSVGISDLNNDGWPDFYVSNDYAVPDYLYINRKDGTFVDELGKQMGHISHSSMGSDVADVNNDGLQDIFTLDMLPEDNKRQKLLLAPDNYDKFNLNVKSGFHYQYMRNMLQLNNGEGGFSEIGQLAGVSNTDWSWAPLLADYNNDGWKDLFITNGYLRDYTNLDFINFMGDFVQKKGRLLRQDVLDILGKMPSSTMTNYIFANQRDGTFVNKTAAFGVDQPANSNGAAYADLDNDGDLDLVVNNINKPAYLYRNNSDDTAGNYLQLKLDGAGGNTRGIGAKVMLYEAEFRQSLVQMPTRGYLSTVSPILHFGLGKNATVDSITIRWNTGEYQTLRGIKAGRQLVLKQIDASVQKQTTNPSPVIFEEIPSPIAFKSPPSAFFDFNRQSLLISQFSHESPCMAKGDLNGDGLADVFVGGAKDIPGAIFLQQADGKFSRHTIAALTQDKASHDSAAAIFDANGDGYADLYVCSGGYHDFNTNDIILQDRLYIGDGKGNFVGVPDALPKMLSSTGTVAVGDLNNDDAPDLFVGGRVVPGRYPETPESFLLINDGKGHYSVADNTQTPDLKHLGMVTDALWADLDQDGWDELIVAGEWMPVTIFGRVSGRLADVTDHFLDARYKGWWNCISASDFNNDGQPDFLIGNMGTNTQFQVSEKEPAELLYSDFDRNGSLDPIFSFYIQGESYPYVTRDELLGQLPYLRSKFTTYTSFADAKLQDIFTPQELDKAKRLEANHMPTSLFLSTENGRYQYTPLPKEVQYSAIYKILTGDFNFDGHKDLLFFGNNEFFKLRLGRSDANYGTLLLGNGKGNFKYMPQSQSGLLIKGDVRGALRIGDEIILGIYGDSVKALHINKPKKTKSDETALSK